MDITSFKNQAPIEVPIQTPNPKEKAVFTTPTGRQSKYQSTPPKFSLQKDAKTGIYRVTFFISSQHFTRTTKCMNEREARTIGQSIRDRVWNEWRISEMENAANPEPTFSQRSIDQPKKETAFISHGFEGVSNFTQRISPTVGQPINHREIQNASNSDVSNVDLRTPITPDVIPNILPEGVRKVEIADAVKAFLDDYQKGDGDEAKKQANSVANARSYLNMFIKDLRNQNCSFVFQITLDALRESRNELEVGHTESTVRISITYMRKFLQWCWKKGFLGEQLDQKLVRRKKVTYGGRTRDYRKKGITWSEPFLKKFLENFDPLDRKAIWLLYHSGIDLADISRIEPANIRTYPDGLKYIELRRLKAKNKTSKSQEVYKFPLQFKNETFNEAGKIINWALKDSKVGKRKFLFRADENEPPTTFTERLTNRRLYVLDNQYSLKMRKEKWEARPTWKAMRSQFFSRMVKQGVPLVSLQRWGGWTDLVQLTRLYNTNDETAIDE